MDPQLWAWVDRVIYDSQNWEDFRAQMGLLESAEQEANQRIVLCDLNWTRLIMSASGSRSSSIILPRIINFAKINKLRIDFALRLSIHRCPLCRVACGAIELAR